MCSRLRHLTPRGAASRWRVVRLPANTSHHTATRCVPEAVEGASVGFTLASRREELRRRRAQTHGSSDPDPLH
eukprot:scaffold269418_cov39-Tisochrysis_lutea.AAC.1